MHLGGYLMTIHLGGLIKSIPKYTTPYNNLNMNTKLGTRHIWEVGEYPSLVMSLPKVWVDTTGIDKNNRIEVEMNEKGWLIVKPVYKKRDLNDQRES